MGGRPLLIIVAGFFLISSFAFMRMNTSNLEQAQVSGANFLRQTAANAAAGGVKLALRKLADDNTWRAGFSDLTIGNGRVSVALIDTVFDGDGVVMVRGTGIAGYGTEEQTTKTSEAVVRLTSLPPALRAAITTRNPMRINGAFTVDGRDYTAGGVLIPGKGIAGLFSTSTVVQNGGATVGGTVAGVDYAPSDPAAAGLIQQNSVYPGGYPGTPDSVLGGAKYGFSEGTLKSIAQSGSGGSQYVTDPSSLAFPLRGVTYVELPSGGTMVNPTLNGSGILVIHNSAGNALLKNVNDGTWSGLIIADDIDGIKINMTGALFCLTTTPSASQVIGNAQGSVRFSREAVKWTIDDTQSRNPKKKETVASGGSELNVIAWRE